MEMLSFGQSQGQQTKEEMVPCFKSKESLEKALCMFKIAKLPLLIYMDNKDCKLPTGREKWWILEDVCVVKKESCLLYFVGTMEITLTLLVFCILNL